MISPPHSRQPRDATDIQLRLDASLSGTGLRCLGSAPLLPDEIEALGVRAANRGETPGVVMIGNAGQALWEPFSGSDAYGDRGPHPLDRYTSRIVTPVTEAVGGLAVFPFDGPPYLPFQRWMLRTGFASQSPIGLLIHQAYGLWFALRAAIVFADLTIAPAVGGRAPCETCEDKPCLTTCPVGAFTPAGYDVAACRAHVISAAGSPCAATGCLARQACPVGAEHRYTPDHAAFHMRAFAPRPEPTAD